MVVESDLFYYRDLATICHSQSAEALGGSVEELFNGFRILDGLKSVSIANTKGSFFVVGFKNKLIASFLFAKLLSRQD